MFGYDYCEIGLEVDQSGWLTYPRNEESKQHSLTWKRKKMRWEVRAAGLLPTVPWQHLLCAGFLSFAVRD